MDRGNRTIRLLLMSLLLIVTAYYIVKFLLSNIKLSLFSEIVETCEDT